jgi:exodeoxyribonuclease VII small subunit
MSESDRPYDFEAALEELEALVERMESGDLTLEESLTAFERGVALTRQCQTALREAELRVKALTEEDEGLTLTDLEDEDFEDDDPDVDMDDDEDD